MDQKIFRQADEVAATFLSTYVSQGGTMLSIHILSVQPDFQTGFSPEPLRGMVMSSSQLAAMVHCIFTYYMINAARFSDGLGMQYRSRYEAWCGQLAALEFTLLQHFYMDMGILTKRDGNIN